MRVVAFRYPVEHVEGEDVEEPLPRVAAILEGDEEICDLTAALPEQWQPIDPINFLNHGEDAFRRAQEAVQEGVHRVAVSQIEILSPVPKPGQVISIAGNYRPYDPSLDATEDAGANDDKGHRASDEEDRQSNAADGEGFQNEHRDMTSQSGSEGGSVRRGSDEGSFERAEADVEGEGEDKSGEGSDAGYQDLPPESDDESTESMDEKARLHLQLTLAGKEKPVPTFFTKYITGTYGMDSFPPFVVTDDCKWLAGAELALIMGRTARRLSEEEAMDYVAGVAIGQDFAERDWVTNEMRWLYGKAYDAPIALGPVMLRREDVKDIDNLKLETWVNGVLVQVGNTRDMEFKCGQILEYVSRFMTLFPGDVILTGRPPPLDGFPSEGVPVKVGDQVSCRMTQIGTISCTVSESDSIDA